MVRRLSLLFGLAFLLSLLPMRAQAQDKFELFGGYSYMRVNGTTSANLNGWELAGQYKLSNWLGGVADFDGHYGSPLGISSSVNTFLFGPQISWRGRVAPFAHVLGGAGHVKSGVFYDTSPAFAIGGGIDSRLKQGIYWRVIQVDYIATRFFGATQNNVRVSTGIVFKF